MIGNYVLMIYPILLMGITLYGAKFSKRGEISSDFLNLDQTKMIQAWACIAIMIHHVTQKITVYGSHNKGPITLFSYIGFLFTALFFFVSGYGLMLNLRKDSNYLSNFLFKRLGSVLIPFWLINWLQIVCSLFVRGDRLRTKDIIKSLIGIKLINSNGWFIIEIVIIYLVFYGVFSLIKNKDIAIGMMGLFIVALIIYSFSLGHDTQGGNIHWFRGEWWFNSTITFLFGLVYARFKESIESVTRAYYIPIVIVFAALTVVMIFATVHALDYMGYYHDIMPDAKEDAAKTLIVQSATSIVSTMLIVLINMKISLNSRILRYIGSILLPLFLVHGYVTNTLLANIRVNDFMRFMIIISASIGITAVIAPIINLIVKKYKSIIPEKKIKVVNDTLEAKQAERIKCDRIRRLKITTAIIAVAVVVGSLAYSVAHVYAMSKEFDEELTSLSNAKVGDIVYFGHYDMKASIPGKERVTWIVEKIDGNKICLLAEYGIAGCWYNQKHQEVTWENSDIREYLNSEEFTDMFSDKEAELVTTQNGDILSLLTVDEAKEFFDSDEDRQIMITDVAEKNGVNINTPSKANSWDMKGYRSSWWWLKGDNQDGSITAPIVTVDGTIDIDKKVVNKPSGAIRPVIWITL